MISAVVVGGVAIFGGSGSAVGAAVGALLLSTISSALNVLGISPDWDQAIAGFQLLVAITLDRGISVKLASGAAGRVEFDIFSGSLDTDVPMMFKSGSRRSVHGEIGSGGGNDFHFKTFSGSVRIR